MTGLLDLSAAAAADAVRAGDLDSDELFDAYRRRAEADDLNAFTWIASEPPPEPMRAPRCSARPTRTSSPWAPPTRTPPSARSSIPGTGPGSPADPPAAAPPRSPPASPRGRSAPT